MVGHFSTPITPESGSFLHADSHSSTVKWTPASCPSISARIASISLVDFVALKSRISSMRVLPEPSTSSPRHSLTAHDIVVTMNTIAGGTNLTELRWR